MVVLSKCISFVYCMMGMTWLVQTTRFSDIPPQFNMSHYTITEPGNRALSRRKTGHTTRFSDIPPRFNMSHYTISEPGNRALSRRKTGHTTRFEGAMLSTLYHSRLQDILKI